MNSSPIMTSELYYLSSNCFEASLSSTYRNLLFDQDFTDVTLVCDDDKQIKAHKVILSSCSPFFKKILLKNPHQHPLIYLKGIGHENLVSITKFIYLGHVEVHHDDLNGFMTAAKDLNISGLIDSVSEEYKYNQDTWYSNAEASGTKIEGKDYVLQEGDYEEKDISSYQGKENDALMTILEDENSTSNTRMKFPCNRCDYKATTNSNLKEHIKGKYIGIGIHYQCDICHKSFTQKGNLSIHKESVHEKKVFACNICESTFSAPTNLSAHKSKYHKLTML